MQIISFVSQKRGLGLNVQTTQPPGSELPITFHESPGIFSGGNGGRYQTFRPEKFEEFMKADSRGSGNSMKSMIVLLLPRKRWEKVVYKSYNLANWQQKCH